MELKIVYSFTCTLWDGSCLGITRGDLGFRKFTVAATVVRWAADRSEKGEAASVLLCSLSLARGGEGVLRGEGTMSEEKDAQSCLFAGLVRASCFASRDVVTVLWLFPTLTLS